MNGRGGYAPSSWRLSTRKALLASTVRRQDYTFRDHFYSFWLGNAFQKCWVSQITMMSDNVALWAWIRHNVRYLSHALSLMTVPVLLSRAGGELTFSEWFRKQLWKKKLFYAVPTAETCFKDCTFWQVSHVKMRLLNAVPTAETCFKDYTFCHTWKCDSLPRSARVVFYDRCASQPWVLKPHHLRPICRT